MANMLPKREEGKKETQWRLEDMYASNEAWEADAALLSEKIEKLGSFRGRLGEGAKVFLEVFRLHDEANMLFEKVYVYANQRHHEDTGNSFYQALSGRAQTLMVALSQAEAYMTPEILALAGDAGSALGTGGMVTKLRAAGMCMAAGCDMVIMNGSRPGDLYRLAAGEPVGTRFYGKKEARV